MAITITPTGAFVVLDETDGLQNEAATPTPAGDADDNDISSGSLPTAFSGRLSFYTLAVDEAALSGYNGTTSSNIITVTGATASSDFALTGEDGVAFTAYVSGATSTFNSGLSAVADDGTITEIFLFTDPTNNNIVYGVAGDSGDDPIAFAIYLEEVKTSGITTGAKMWTVIADGYTIAHDVDGSTVADHDDFLDLTDKLFVSAIGENNFSFANAPSGQNLFMMFGDTSLAILITGEDPANQSAGQHVSNDGDTVSSSQGGGPTTLGTEGQHIKAQKALVVTFVTGANADYIAGPNAGNNPGQPLSPTEANVEANIAFSGYAQDVLGAGLTISQMNPGSSNTTATVELEAYLTADGTGTNYINNNDPLVTGDTQINIASVQVIRGGIDVTNTLTITLSGLGATITGVKDNDVIQYTTDSAHNRVLIRNDQPSGSNVSFDLGGFKITQVASDVEEIGSKVRFEDDGPNAVAKNVAGPTATVDESPLPAAGDGVNTATIAAATIAALFEAPAFGADGQGSVSYTLSGTDNAQTGLWLTGESGAANEIRLFKVSDTLWEGHKGVVGGTLAFTVSINSSTGEVTLTRSSATLEHTTDGSSAAAHDDALTMAATANLFVVQHITDGDGDTDSATAVNPLTLKFEDDGPAVTVNDTSGTYAAGAQGTWSDDDPGSDGFASLSVTFDGYEIDANGAQPGSALTQTGLAFDGSITDDFNGDGIDETVEFTLTFNRAANTYDLEVTTPPTTIITFDTSQGSLKAGGPDAVQTLLFGGSEAGADDIVFFGVVPTAPFENGTPPPATNDIEDLVVVGATDLTEGQIEALLPLPGLITPGTQMNVSTSGIGVNNNNLNGADQGAGTGAFAGTTITSGDESFVVNPEKVVDKVTVFIDNSVGSYNPATEDLYFTVYFTDGSVQAPVKVTAGMLTPVTSGVASGGFSFEIDGGDKQIDAVQLTMGKGTIKVPVIAFSVEQAFEPEPLSMDFTATLFDGDGDSSSDAFTIDLAETVV